MTGRGRRRRAGEERRGRARQHGRRWQVVLRRGSRCAREDSGADILVENPLPPPSPPTHPPATTNLPLISLLRSPSLSPPQRDSHHPLRASNSIPHFSLIHFPRTLTALTWLLSSALKRAEIEATAGWVASFKGPSYIQLQIYVFFLFQCWILDMDPGSWESFQCPL